ncbi:hypothetical protein HS088_TW09G01222 [Tripterygium wilfordii]|uniref:YGGT family protein n=1 Tax=Tripterygium wilfordii TaxID=458696 RepID=A0A7J7D9X4_TRIWF|nr:ylmG homolog protein 2, chloroplastic [Tripterygium wilfordii]KAF5743157.1 hypothetical protein HS088_TW09G01222 [Tripterygium wilfordii]
MVMEASTENPKFVAPRILQPSLMLSVQNSFPRPIRSSLCPQNFIRHLHSSIASTSQKLRRFLHLFLNENPILRKILSVRSDLNRTFSQIQCRHYRNQNCLSNHGFAAVLPGDSVAGIVVANGLMSFLNLYNTLLIVRLVLTWFPNTPPAIVSPLSTLCDPYLNIFRGIIPPLGGTLDLSPILAFLVLNAFTSTAAALPAELPEAGSPQVGYSSHARSGGLTTSQMKWMKRLSGNQSKSSVMACRSSFF